MQGRSWGLGTGLGILKRDVGVQQETGRDTESREESQRASSEKERTHGRASKDAPVLLGTDKERQRPGRQGRGGHELRPPTAEESQKTRLQPAPQSCKGTVK